MDQNEIIEEWMNRPEIYRKFAMHFPCMNDHVKEFHPIGGNLLEIYYKDESIGVFDGLLNTFRFIPKGQRQILTEGRWKIELGNRIYRTMLEKGMLMTELSEISGISYGTLSKYVNGRLSPGSYTLKRIASALGVAVGYLTDFERYYQ